MRPHVSAKVTFSLPQWMLLEQIVVTLAIIFFLHASVKHFCRLQKNAPFLIVHTYPTCKHSHTHTDHKVFMGLSKWSMAFCNRPNVNENKTILASRN